MGKKVMKKPAMKAAAMKVVKKAAMKTMKKSVAMKAAKKVMKTMKAVMMKKKVATGMFAKSMVFSGRREKTVGGLKKSHLKKNKHGKVVSAAQSAQAKKTLCSAHWWMDHGVQKGPQGLEHQGI